MAAGAAVIESEPLVRLCVSDVDCIRDERRGQMDQ